MQEYAYVTLATSIGYLKEAYLLQESLKKTQSKYKLIILITDNLKKENFSLLDEYIIIPKFQFFLKKKWDNDNILYLDTLNKFQAFNLIQYKKLLFIDADIFLFNNLDYIFEKYSEYEFISLKNYYPKRYQRFFNESLPTGGIMLITPQKFLFDELLLFRDHPMFIDDEFVLKYFLYPQFFMYNYYNKKCSTFEQLKEKNRIEASSFHDEGRIKLCLYLKNLDVKELCIQPLETIKVFFLIWKEYKGQLKLKK